MPQFKTEVDRSFELFITRTFLWSKSTLVMTQPYEINRCQDFLFEKAKKSVASIG